MPAARLAFGRPCLDGLPACVASSGRSYRGRRNCRRADLEFRLMEGDLFNLVPAIGELNGVRGNLEPGEVPGERREFGRCDFEVTRGRRRGRGPRVVEPRPEVRGDVARAYLYLARTYGMLLSPEERRRFTAWHRADQPDAWERERARRIVAAQGGAWGW